MGNKTTELECLNLTIERFPKQHGISQKILNMLTGTTVDRQEDERPDFMLQSKATNNKKDIILGLEHFRVDHYNRKKGANKVLSLSAEFENKVKNTFSKWQPQINENNRIPDGALSAIGELLNKKTAYAFQATYKRFMQSFEYSLNKHISFIDAYKDSLKPYSQNYNTKLAFLIEIYTDFGKLYYHDENGVHHDDNPLPLFEDMVTHLESLNSKGVDYVILCFRDEANKQNAAIAAVPTENIRKQFNKLGYHIYHYAGEDLFLTDKETPFPNLKVKASPQMENREITFHTSITFDMIDNKVVFVRFFFTYLLIKLSKEEKNNYATTFLMERLYNCFDSIIFPNVAI